ncbi:MAG: hypothetical protein ACE5HI_03355 [bacterium]
MLPRSFIGRGVLIEPSWLDLIVPFMAIMMLWSVRPKSHLDGRGTTLAILDAVGLLMFPLLTGVGLFLYVSQWLVIPQITLPTFLRWIQFTAAFLAINMFIDALPLKNKWGKRGVILLAVLAMGTLQDWLNNQFLILSIASSVGTTFVLTVLAFRPLYLQSPWRAVLAAAIVGAIICFLVVAVRSDSMFTLFLPFLALLIGALTIKSSKRWPRWVAVAAVVAVALFLSIGLPRIVSPEFAEMLDERPTPTKYTEEVGSIAVHFDDSRLGDVAKKMARVLEAANEVSKEEFGVSPQVKHLTIWGIFPGGFYADFPDKINGNLISERFIDLAQDSSFLNNPNRSIHFLDPVIGILHEYSHLYGVIFYWPWLNGAEEEGWATYAATRLALRLFDKYGPELWDPPYDYAAQARAITESNLDGHPVAWSHAHEFGGFRLWHALGERDGEEELFRKRWDLTRRDALRMLMFISDPQAARRMADGMGYEDFVSFGTAAPVSFKEVYALKDQQVLADLMENPVEDAKTRYERLANKPVNPSIKVPRSHRHIDIILTFVVVVLAFGVNMVTKQASSSTRA